MCLSAVAKAGLSQVTPLRDRFLVRQVAVSVVKASQRAGLAPRLENVASSARLGRRP